MLGKISSFIRKKKRLLLFPFYIYMFCFTLFFKCKEFLVPDFNKNCDQKYKDCWLFVDRVMFADDNAEHFYRYVKKLHPEIKIFFLLSSDSCDWVRLQKEFRLITYGSLDHQLALKKCSMIISSHADNDIVNFFGEHTDWKKKFIFLQHGITKDDLSDWLNFKNISLLVASTKAEYDSFLTGKYLRLTKDQVKLLGMPRHDNLLKINNPQKIILVCPTWRKYLLNLAPEAINRDLFTERWQQFLSSERLHYLTQEYGYKIVFYPHHLLRNIIQFFSFPSYIDCESYKFTTIQHLIASAALLVTDYSSLSFEMALLRKPTVYYQFDKKKMFSGSHTYKEGYFNYELDSFGEVSQSLSQLLDSIAKELANGCIPNAKYLHRMEKTFVFRDGNNCKRVFNAISMLKNK